MNPKTIFALGAGLCALAIMTGAFGAHALKERLGDYERGVYEKATFYHFIHALGLLLIACGIQSGLLSSSAAAKSALCMLAGVVLFSGSLYLLALTGIKWLGAITPLGGTLFIISWILVIYGALKAN